MPRINNKDVYTIDNQLSLDDFVIGSDADNADKTRNYLLRGVFSTFKNSLNLSSIEFTFAGGSDPDIDHTDAGFFSTNSDETSFAAISSLLINKLDLNGIDISSIVDVVSGNVSSFTVRLSKPSASGQVFYFQINSITDNTTHYAFSVTPFVGGTAIVDETTYSLVFDLSGVPSVLTESDPVFSESAAAGISGTNISNWNTAFGWGDHGAAGYQDALSGTGIVKSTAGTISYVTDNSTNWNTAFGWGNHADEGYLTSYTETDPVFSVSAAAGVTSILIGQWNAAYGWGDHSLVGYITSETDPVFSASAASGITSGDITQWDAAYQWGDHAAVGYLVAEDIDTISELQTLVADTTIWHSGNLDPSDYVAVAGDTMTGNLLVPNIGINRTTSPVSKLTIGDYIPFPLAPNPTVVLLENFTGIDANGRGFADNTSLDLSANRAYNSFDAHVDIYGSNDIQHVSGFQSRPRHNNTGATEFILGFASYLQRGSGSVDDMYHFYVENPFGSGTAITNQYGLYINDLTAASNNYSIFTGIAPSRFGGDIIIESEKPILRLTDSNSTGDTHQSFISFRDSADSEKAWVGFGFTNNSDFSISNGYSGGTLTLLDTGNINYSGNSMLINGGVVPTMKTESSRQNKILGCVIRATAGTWAFISDSSHFNSGFTSISSDSNGTVTINYDETFNKVINLNATVDETFAQNEIFVGASVGVSSAQIKLFKRLFLGDYISYNGSNFVSFDGVFTIDSYVSGVLTVSHRELSGSLNEGFNIQISDRDTSAYINRIGSVGDSTIQIKFYNFDGTQYTGAANTDMKFFLSRSGVIQLTASEASISGANIWVTATMQV